jgi:hypothetical protein
MTRAQQLGWLLYFAASWYIVDLGIDHSSCAVKDAHVDRKDPRVLGRGESLIGSILAPS